MLMRADGRAAAHVNDDDIDVLIGLAHGLRPAPCHRLLVQRMVDGHTLHLRNTGNPRNRLELIHNDGVHDIGRDTQRITNLPCKNAAEIRCVLSLYALLQILLELVRHAVCASRNGTQQAAASYNEVQGLQVNVLLPERVEDELLAEILLRVNAVVLVDLLGRMTERLIQDLLLVVEDADFGRRGTGIDDQAAKCHSAIPP